MISYLNRKAKFEYTFIKNYNAGICLIGTEIKSLRAGKVNIDNAYCLFDNNELYIKNLNISQGSVSFQHEPLRDRKLLLKKLELKKLESSLDKGLTIIPVRIYLNDRNMFKIEIALAKGKKLYDKRETIKARDIERDINRNI